MPKHSPQREQGICQQHFPASLCHAGAHGFASSLPGREWMSLNLHPLSNLAEISQQARKPSGGAGVDTHTQSTGHLLLGKPGKRGSSFILWSGPCSPGSLSSAWSDPTVRGNLCSMGWGPDLGTELVSSQGTWLKQVQGPPQAAKAALQRPERWVKPVPTSRYHWLFHLCSFAVLEFGVTFSNSLQNQKEKPETLSESLACCYQGH